MARKCEKVSKKFTNGAAGVGNVFLFPYTPRIKKRDDRDPGEAKETRRRPNSSRKARARHNKTADKRVFGDWLDEWIGHKRSSVKESTFIRYRNIVYNHIAPKLGDHTVSEITTDLLNRFLRKELVDGRLDGRGGLSAKTVSDILTVIKDVFKYVRNSGEESVCDLRGITVKKSSREMKVLSRGEAQRLLSVLTRDMDRYKLGVYVCLFTGMRIGELCALRWKDISFSEKTLRVGYTMQRLQNENANRDAKTKIVITEPKTSSSRRVIPLPDFLLDVLRPFEGSEESFVLSGSEAYKEPRTMQYRFKKYLKEGQIAQVGFHSLRHTFATRCVEIGFDIKTLSEILGHSSVRITLDRYVHSSMEQKMSNMEKLITISFDSFPRLVVDNTEKCDLI